MTSHITTPIKSVDHSQSTEERLTDNAVNNILPARYLLDDETPDDMFRRVAHNVALAEDKPDTEDHWEERFYEVMSTQQFIPNSPTLMNAGAELQQLSACFVLEVGDSMAESDEFGRESILDTVKHAGQIFKSGGGVGYTFSHLRPKGAHIESTDSETSGPMQFMRLFDEVCNTVKQGGKRRGAQMAIMRCDHPDIGRFAVSKREEGAFSNFNISVGVTDEFVDAVENDEMYTLYDPQSEFEESFETVQQTAHFYNKEYADSPEAVVDKNIWRDHATSIQAWDWEKSKTTTLDEKWQGEFNIDTGEEMALPARFIWDLILDGAWRNGEPGLFYLDETNRQHSFGDLDGENSEYKIHATNPSLVAGTPVLTDDGVKPIEELEDTTFKTRSLNNNWAEASCWKSGEDEELYEITTNTGFTYEATPQHEWPVVSDGSVSKKRSDELEAGDFVPLTETDSLGYGDSGGYSDGLLIGWLYGDGSITTRTEENRADFQYGFTISEEDADAGILEFIVQKLKEITGTEYSPTERNRGGEDWYEIHVCNQDIVEYMDSFDVSEKSSGIPDSVWSNASEEFRKGFVDGLFSADGCISEQNSRVTLTTSRSQIAEDVVSLLSFYGVKAQQREGVSELNGEEYERHEVTISNTPALRFRELFNLSHDNKQQSLESLSETEYTTVKSSCVKIESVNKSDKIADVWDISVLDESHTFPIAGITTGNCAEQPLCDFEACNLGHVNLSLLMEEDSVTFDEWLSNQDTDFERRESAVHEYLFENVDWEQMQEVVHTGTRFLDNVVTMSDFPLEQIDETVESMRKIGLGVMGWAQMLYQMGLRYGSHESLEAARVVMNFIDKEATAYSHELAKERGVFSAWSDSKYANPTEYEEWFYSHAHELPEDWEDGYPLRNHNVTTVAPTGTTSMIGDTSGGIEPVYNVAYKKNVGNDIQGAEKLVEFDDYFLQTLEANGIDSEAVKEECARLMDANEFESVQQLDAVPEEIKDLFVTTNDISSMEHGLMQRAFQEKNDSGISKTINLPNEATHADVHNSYMLALASSDDKFGAPIKGLTVYRDESRKEQVLMTTENTEKELEEAVEKLEASGYTVINPEEETENEAVLETVGGDD